MTMCGSDPVHAPAIVSRSHTLPMNNFRPAIAALVFLAHGTLHAQSILPDPDALEGVVVERYYVADANDAADEDGSAQLVAGAVTYRVFLDMKDGYELQILGGFPGHPLTFHTTTTFFNNEDRGEAWGDAINDIHLNKNTVAIDSWLSIGAASDAHWGVLKSDDPDGAQEGVMFPNDGGSNAVEGGLLANPNGVDIPLNTADGLMTGDAPPPASTFVGTAPEIFNTGGADYSDENFGLAVLGDVVCPTPGNKILVGQFTTDGVFSFCLNLWLRIPDSLVCTEPECLDYIIYYADLQPNDTADVAGIPGNYTFTRTGLCYSSEQQTVDCLGIAGGTALPGTACDDANADTQNDVYDADCTCIGEDCNGVLGGTALPGQPCDDGDELTVNDTLQIGCICVGTPVGIAEYRLPSVLVYPNPARDALYVQLGADAHGRATVDLIDALGSRVLRHDLGVIGADRLERFDLSGLSAGMYFVETTIDGHAQRTRITKF